MVSKVFLFLLTILVSFSLAAQENEVRLIPPTGPYEVGTMSYEWTDMSRGQQITAHVGDRRIIAVQIWYPAQIDSTAIEAPYSSLSKDYRRTLTNSYLRPEYHPEINASNLILIAPGRGTERYLYTTIAEELASNGFTVASVDMPEIGYVIYSDGMTIKPSKEFQPPRGMMGGPYEKVDIFFEKPTAIGTTDLEFAFQKISELNSSDPNGRFTDKINLSEIAIMGHSLGGRIAGNYTNQNEQVKAYLSMEGIPPRDIRYEGKIKIPQVMLCSSGTWPYAKENYFSLIENRSAPVYMIELPDFGHNSITDNPYIYPGSFNYAIDPAKGLEISRTIILSYFNSVLRNEQPLEQELKNITMISLEVYE